MNHRGHFCIHVLICSQASNCDSDDPTYPSNLSAALYELGDYPAAVHAILRAFHLLAPDGRVADASVQLARKLSLRLVKALLHASRKGKIPEDVIGRPEHQGAFDTLEHMVSDDPNAAKLWSAWSAVAEEKLDDVLRAKRTLLELPIWRKSPCVFPAQSSVPFAFPPQRRLGASHGPCFHALLSMSSLICLSPGRLTPLLMQHPSPATMSPRHPFCRAVPCDRPPWFCKS